MYLQMNTGNVAVRAQELCACKLAMECAVITEAIGTIKSIGFYSTFVFMTAIFTLVTVEHSHGYHK